MSKISTAVLIEKIEEIRSAIVSCIGVGDHIWFDDGKIGGIIEDKSAEYAIVRITKAGAKGTRLKKEKGINLPDTRLLLPSLTEDDISYLPFVVQNADVVGYSFVRTAHDVKQLMENHSHQPKMIRRVLASPIFDCIMPLKSKLYTDESFRYYNWNIV